MDVENEIIQKFPLESKVVANQDIEKAWGEMIGRAKDHIYLASPWIYAVDKFDNSLSKTKEKHRVTV